MYDSINRMLESDFFEKCEKYLETAKFSANLLLNLISDLLDLAKFETQTFSFNSEYFDLLDVIKKSFE